MNTPRLLLPLLLAALLAGAAGATPITANADLSGTVHDGENHAGANGDNSLFLGASFVGTVLSSNASPSSFLNADFGSANLTSATLRNGNYSGANFVGATMTNAQMRDGNFTNADFSGVVMGAANVRGANFTGASLVGTDLSAATNWSLANWTGASYDVATLFPAGMDPVAEGMVLASEPHAALMLGAGLLGLGVFGARHRSA